jgi:hypothetical protein
MNTQRSTDEISGRCTIQAHSPIASAENSASAPTSQRSRRPRRRISRPIASGSIAGTG